MGRETRMESAMQQANGPTLMMALPHVHRIASMIRLLRVSPPTNLLGVISVLEGTSLGNAVHHPGALRIKALPAERFPYSWNVAVAGNVQSTQSALLASRSVGAP